MKVRNPPTSSSFSWSQLAKESPELMDAYMEWATPIDAKGRYLHYDELRYRVPKPLKPEIVWRIIKQARNKQRMSIIALGEPPVQCHAVLTPRIQKALSETDRNTTAAALEAIAAKVGEKQRFSYLVQDLIEDESISSSQLEGAATTTRVARNMLRQQRKARTPDEKMILGNFKMMLHAWKHRHRPLALDLIQELHHVGVEGIDDDHYHPGVFRHTDDVVVEDSEGNVVHTPPPAKNLSERLQAIIDWMNTDHNTSDHLFIHPLLKAIVLHFCIGYEHPFRDGNGRVARALFYWFMYRSDFVAFRYISISALLKEHATQYGKSYLYTETDEMDLTYFIDHQCRVVLDAIDAVQRSWRRAAEEMEAFNRWLWNSGLYQQLNDKQRIVFQVAKSGEVKTFTIRNVEHNLNCSYNTAAAVLNGLVDLKLFHKRKEGRQWVYTMADKEDLIKNWS